MKSKTIQKAVFVSIVCILILTVFEFPTPIGFETRPQNNVSMYWLILFLSILVSEIATMVFIFKKPLLGARLGVFAGMLNILQIIADQTHMMQPETAPLGYLLLEDAVGILSLALIYFSWKFTQNTNETLVRASF